MISAQSLKWAIIQLGVTNHAFHQFAKHVYDLFGMIFDLRVVQHLFFRLQIGREYPFVFDFRMSQKQSI